MTSLPAYLYAFNVYFLCIYWSNFKTLALVGSPSGARIQNKILIKVRNTSPWDCRINGASFGGPSDMTLPASLGDRDLMGMLCSCYVSLGKHLRLESFPTF